MDLGFRVQASVFIAPREHQAYYSGYGSKGIAD